jgi:hypothetical protein
MVYHFTKKQRILVTFCLMEKQKQHIPLQIIILTFDNFLSPCSAETHSELHNSISTVSVAKNAQYGSMTLPPALNVDFEATVVIGIASMSCAILDKMRYLVDWISTISKHQISNQHPHKKYKHLPNIIPNQIS